MSELREAAKQALEALQNCANGEDDVLLTRDALAALRAALEQPEPFQPDWDRIEPLQEALREHMAEIHRLRAALEQPDRAQRMRDAGYTRRQTLREMADPEQPEQEPVACNACVGSIAHVQHGLPIGTKLFTHPPRREWRGLDKDETMHLMNDTAENYWAYEAHIQRFARAIEAALKERNA
jgi:GR25 family glycosyltransferase involved in LPS biosynthesis